MIENKEHFSAWHQVLLVCSLPSLAAIIGFVFLPESPRYLLEAGREVEAMMVYQVIIFRAVLAPPSSILEAKFLNKILYVAVASPHLLSSHACLRSFYCALSSHYIYHKIAYYVISQCVHTFDLLMFMYFSDQ